MGFHRTKISAGWCGQVQPQEVANKEEPLKKCACGQYALFVEDLGLYRCFHCGRMWPASEPDLHSLAMDQNQSGPTNQEPQKPSDKVRP